MNNKKAAVILATFIVLFMLLTAILGLSEHIPLLGKPLALFIAVLLIIFVLIFFILLIKRRK